MNLSLFSTKPSQSGFRLHTFEVWNWGTFDKDIFSIEPGGETSLLTGGNGSGKTTLVDGLLTLLLPERRARAYNQTAGEKGERTEETYLLGEFGETENSESKTREVKKLRGDKSKAQSVLIAVFQNESQFVTVAQARWFSGSELKRNFVISYKKLSIKDDFMPFDSNGEWKKRLKQKYPKQGVKDSILFTDSPGEYGRWMRKAFGMRSDKAQTLFNKTIGLKVLGNLDEFVRLQMLEGRESEEEFQKIKSYFKTLNDAHRAIEKAHKQIELLAPVRDKSIRLTTLNADLIHKEIFKQTAPLWFAKKQDALIQEFMASTNEQIQENEEKLVILTNEVEELDHNRIKLDVQIESDEVGRQIRDLEKDNKRFEQEKSDREKELSLYNQLAENLEFQQSPQTRELFDDQRKLALDKKKKTAEVLEQNEEELFQTRKESEEARAKFDNISNELGILRSQKNNITGHPARIRSEILEAIGATEKEIPFVGELLKVRKEAREWESAIERLLHNFALRLIVPEEYYQQVNQYVKENDLRGRIIYHKFNKKEVAPRIFIQQDEQELISKLDFKTSEYTEWIKNEISSKFNYLCVDDLESFRLAKRAITREGLTKNVSRHEKDDRPEVRSRQQYVLGWDNGEKIAVLKEEAAQLNDKINTIDNRLKAIRAHQTRVRKEAEDLTRFIDFKAFKKIDWWSLSAEIQENKLKIEGLEKTNDRVNTLKKQREEIAKTIKAKQEVIRDLEKEINLIDSQLNIQQQKLREAREVIERYADLEIADKLVAFDEHFMKEIECDIDSIEKVRIKIIGEINQDLDRLKDDIRKIESAAEGLMRLFKNPDKEIVEKFSDWNSDTHRLSESAEFIEEYVALLEKIEKEELAEYKQQFKQYLNEEMITKMSDFQTWMERQEEDIEENIETLNKSLEKINFKSNPPTFIKLHVEKDYSPKVKEFRFRLNAWKPNLAEFERTKDDSILEESFNKIKTLLDHLTEDENLRKEVLDVRNWLKFKAVEHHKEDPRMIFRSYTGTAKLSGGEGAQLTYTILGSAIAYQFGIHSEGLNTNSFRFICVDEAFSKQDDEKAQFLMELCKQLHLQVMVVSPAKAEEVSIVEPYIARVHFVQRKDNRHSVVYDMPIKQLQEQREQYLQSVV
ncbi:ATP-binding protein [Algoriphagus sp. PAP.12]|uniref:ATP-binding protein n=1 Tax=Algoriphagus sp. PAP.12 TaxID=2996678 RepID=UPI00227AA125|nr:SbcC/MukB-like Walker B domain-containing protein [Algoriphagus sp. PAP.12]